MTLCNLDDYRVSMADRRRVSTYRDALAKAVPGRIVCELGVGYVPLGLMALQLGAERVYAIDSDSEALRFARESVYEHGFAADQYITLCGDPATVRVPELSDVLVAEPLSSIGFCEDTGVKMAVACERLLVPGGQVLPRRIRCFAALAGPTQFARQLDLWTRDLPSLVDAPGDALERIFRSNTQTMVISPAALLGDWAVWREFAFHDPGKHREIRSLILKADRLGMTHGVACCFEAELCDGVTVRTFPDAFPTPWQQAFTPFGQSFRVEAGDEVYVQLMADEQAPMGSLFESLVLGSTKVLEDRDTAAA